MRINTYQLVLFFGLIMLAGCPETGSDSSTGGGHGAEAQQNGEVNQEPVECARTNPHTPYAKRDTKFHGMLYHDDHHHHMQEERKI